MDNELVWKMELRQVETSIRKLAQRTIDEERFDRLRELSFSLHDIEREILDHFQKNERGKRATRPIHPLFRAFMRQLHDFYCVHAFSWEWAASKIRTRLTQHQPSSQATFPEPDLQ
jgi:hypothetical protein